MNQYIVGHHINHGDGFIKSIEETKTAVSKLGIEMTAAQIFVLGPRNSKTISDDYTALGKYAAANNITLYIHGSYLDNPWSKNPNFSKQLIQRELKIADECNALGVVIHLRRHTAQMIADSLSALVKDTKSTLFLEVEATKSSENTYETAEKLDALWRAIPADIINRIGICIDTAHLWAAGVDLQNYKTAGMWLSQFDDFVRQHNIPANRILFHINDQTWAKGSGRDMHAPLSYGTIWKDFQGNLIHKSGLAAFVYYAQQHNVGMIFERKSEAPKIPELEKAGLDNITSDYIVLHNIQNKGV